MITNAIPWKNLIATSTEESSSPSWESSSVSKASFDTAASGTSDSWTASSVINDWSITAADDRASTLGENVQSCVEEPPAVVPWFDETLSDELKGYFSSENDNNEISTTAQEVSTRVFDMDSNNEMRDAILVAVCVTLSIALIALVVVIIGRHFSKRHPTSTRFPQNLPASIEERQPLSQVRSQVSSV